MAVKNSLKTVQSKARLITGTGRPRRFRPGDTVRWNDPDGGTCSKLGVIRSAVYRSGLVDLELTDGWCAEVLHRELVLIKSYA